MKYPTPLLTGLLLCLRPCSSDAGPGDTDLSFNPGQVVSQAADTQVAVQSNGKVIIGGDFTALNGTLRNRVARLNADGSVDATFGNGLAGANDIVYAVALQANGQILIGGAFTMVNGQGRSGIARLNADGSLDGAFPNDLLDSWVDCVALQSDGKILIGGDFTSVTGTARSQIARLNADGSLDSSFLNITNGLTGANGDVFSLVLQPNGQILIGGAFTRLNGSTRLYTARLNADGSVDSSFLNGQNGQTGGDKGVNALVLQPDGKVILGGSFASVNGTSRNYLARLNNDGSLDGSFLANGLAGANSYVYALALQTNGQVLIGGAFTSVNGAPLNRFARLNADGSLDGWFLYGLAGADDFVGSLALQSDGKIIIGGDFATVNGVARNQVARLLVGYDAPRLDSPSFTNGQFGFNLIGAPGQTLVVQASTDLPATTWTPISTNVLGGGPLPFSDPQTSLFTQRFYRLFKP